MNTLDVIDVSNHEQVTHLLLEKGADPNVTAVDPKAGPGWTALLYASQNGHADVRAYSFDDSIHHMLHDITEVTDVTNHEQVVRLLLENSADANHENKKHVTALNMACEKGHEACAQLLLRAGARHDVADDWGDSPYSIAQKKGLASVLALMQ